MGLPKGSKGFKGNSVTLDFKIDTSVLTQIKKNVQQAGNRTINYGWLNRKRYTGREYRSNGQHKKNAGLSVAMVALWLELGTRKMPARPLFTKTMRQVRKTAPPMMGEYFRLALVGAYEPQLVKIGEMTKTAFKAHHASQSFTPLKPTTIKIKGFSYILYHSGEYQANFDYEIVRKSIDKVVNPTPKLG